MKQKRHFFSAFRKACLIITCALLFNGCEVFFTNPLPDSLKAERDERLAGRWLSRGEHGSIDYIKLTRDGTDAFIINFETGDSKVHLRARALKIDGANYLSLTDADSRPEGYFLARYVITGDKLKVWLLDDKLFRQAIKDGKLKGEMGVESYSGASITDTPEKILDFIKTHGDAAFKLLVELERAVD